MSRLNEAIVFVEMLGVQGEAVAQAAECGEAKTDLIEQATALVMGVARVMLVLLGKYPAQIFRIAIPSQNIDRHLLHDHGLLDGRHQVGPLGDQFLDRPLIVAVGVDLEAIKLDFLDIELAGALDHVSPTFDGLAREAEDELDVHRHPHLVRLFDGFDRLGGIMVSVHQPQNLVIQRLDADGQPIGAIVAQHPEPLAALFA